MTTQTVRPDRQNCLRRRASLAVRYAAVMMVLALVSGLLMQRSPALQAASLQDGIQPAQLPGPIPGPGPGPMPGPEPGPFPGPQPGPGPFPGPIPEPEPMPTPVPPPPEPEPTPESEPEPEPTPDTPDGPGGATTPEEATQPHEMFLPILGK